MPVVLAFPELAILVVVAGCLIFLYLCVLIVHALFTTASGAVSWIPGVGGWLSGKAHDLEHKITHVFGVAIAGVEDAGGYSLHLTARLIDWTGRELERHANLIHMLAVAIPGAGAFIAIRDEINSLRKLLHGTTGTQALSLRHLLDLEKRLAHGIGNDVIGRIHAEEKAIARVVEHDIASLRARERALENDALHTFKWIRAHPGSLATAAFAGAVAFAIRRLGLNWIRCNNWKRIGERVCHMPLRLIEDLLAGVIDVLVIVDLCRLTKIMVTLAESSVVQGALNGLIVGLDDLILCQGVDRPPALAGYWTDPPPLQAFAALPG